ncbi:O-antigen ligase family protein [Candidatus Roizmanbacteria bacterium]|nr:O-antigen ligase family protein [Candidatus Roizmanbacteria bacterium]
MDTFLQRITRWTWYALFLLTPLLFTPFNYELFEFNKMLFVYALTIMLIVLGVFRKVTSGRPLLLPTPLDIPLFLFLASQVFATMYSIDQHTSIWGYYGRFNGGLISIICYLLLYYLFLYFYRTEDTNRHLMLRIFSVIIAGGIITAVYGIAQHLGIDAHIWVQDVQNRIFSTLGQPNWLAAYLAVILPVSISLLLLNRKSPLIIAVTGGGFISLVLFATKLTEKAAYGICFLLQEQTCSMYGIYLFILGYCAISVFLYKTTIASYIAKRWNLLLLLVSVSSLYLTLLFTKSRSGFIAFWVSYTLFWLLQSISAKKYIPNIKDKRDQLKNLVVQPFFRVTIPLLLITILIGSPFPHIPTLRVTGQTTTSSSVTQTPEEVSIPEETDVLVTDSGDIRKIVWQGAWDAMKARPWLGWGPETFAWVYYRFRPAAHNLTSEWDFLYNKAHNEYLNFAATTGLIGIGSYILIILTTCIWFIRRRVVSFSSDFKQHTMTNGLFAGWFSLLITNFFGFSVVMTNLLFFMIPAMIVLCFRQEKKPESDSSVTSTSAVKIITMIIIGIVGCYFLFTVIVMWFADYHFAKGYAYARDSRYQLAHRELSQAIVFTPEEPLFRSENANTNAALALAAFEQEDATTSAAFIEEALSESATAIATSPYNVSFWKARTRLFYTLSQLDPSFLSSAQTSIEMAEQLAPTDAKISYNAAIIYNALGKNDKAIVTLIKTMELKPNYRDAAWALALIYEEEKNSEESQRWLRYILEKINPEDHEAKEKLGEK